MKKLKILLFITSYIFSLSAHAYLCSGKIDLYQVTAAGKLQIHSAEIYGDNTGRTICSVANPLNGVTTDSCNTWVSMIITSKAIDSELTIQYSDSLSCTTQPDWDNASTPHMIRQ